MPIVGGPIGVLLVAGASVVALVAWLLRDRRHPGPRLVGDDGIDREELEEAEREVRELETGRRPEEGSRGTIGGRARPSPGAGELHLLRTFWRTR